MKAACFALFALVWLSAPALAMAAPTTDASASVSQSDAHTDAAPLFTFQSNLWINLHHFLRAVARGMPAPSDMNAADREVWDEVVARYRPYAERNVLLDEGMVAIKNTLRAVGDQDPLPEIPGEPELDDLLESAASVYRKHWWPTHDTLNRSWIAAARPLVDRYGREIAPRIAQAYGQEWPDEPIPVDVTVIGGPVGAYTTTPTHVIMPSVDPSYLGLASLEMLFHEPSHQWGRLLQKPISREAERLAKDIPRQLWHAVLFYNAGELTRRTLADHGFGTYRHYAVDLYEVLCGEGCRDLVAEHWDRRLAGERSVDEALTELVAAWPDVEARGQDPPSEPAVEAKAKPGPDPGDPGPCDSPRHRELDFWLGEWRLTWPGGQGGAPEGGTGAGTNRITPILDGCVVHERFHSEVTGLDGESWTAFDEKSGEWRQTWVDDQGSYLTFSGGIEDGFMTLYGPERTTPDGYPFRLRMRWTDVTDEGLTWRYQRTVDGGSTWSDAWVIRYERMPGADAPAKR